MIWPNQYITTHNCKQKIFYLTFLATPPDGKGSNAEGEQDFWTKKNNFCKEKVSGDLCN